MTRYTESMRKNHEAHVAANLALVRYAVERVGGPEGWPAPLRDGLDLVTRWVAGEDVPREELSTAATTVHGYEHASRHGPVAWGGTAIGNLCWQATRGRGWQDGDRSIGDAAKYTITSSLPKGKSVEDQLAVYADVEAFHERALAEAYEAVKKKPKPRRKKSVAPRQRKPKDLTPFIGALAARHLAKLKGRVDPLRVGDEAKLRAALAEAGYEAHPELIAFDARYGGVVADENIGLGAWAMLSGGIGERGGAGLEAEQLVPVAYSGDVFFFLGRGGRGWVQSMVTDPRARPITADGDALVAQLLLVDLHFSAGFRDRSVVRAGRHGAELAATLGLAAIPEASGEGGAFWGDGKTMIFEVEDPEDGWVTRVNGPGAKRVTPEGRAAVARR